MRVIVYPHELIIGGCPINAIDLARAVADRGHDVAVYGVPGPLVDYIAEKGLRFIPAHSLKYRPAPTRIWQLAAVARRERVDLIHAYEWPPCLDAYYGAHLVGGVPLVCSVLSMSLVPLVPGSVPLVLGTRQMQEAARPNRPETVALLEPPVDTEKDDPSVDGSAFRAAHGIGRDDLLAVTVSRMSIDLKLDALVRAIDAVARLAGHHRLRLVMVGTGEAVEQLTRRAERVNAALGREVVTLAGATLDPRPAYAAADVVLGMGGSALRAMAFAKPVIVQGEEGFSLILDPDTLHHFSWQGFYGIGDGDAGGDRLAGQLEALLTDPDRRRRLGRFGREIVVREYSLQAKSAALLDIYDQAQRNGRAVRRLLPEAARMAARAAGNEVRLHLPSDKQARRAHEAGKLAAAG